MNSKTNIVQIVRLKCYALTIDTFSKEPFKLADKSIIQEIKTIYNNYMSFQEIIILNDYNVISTS